MYDYRKQLTWAKLRIGIIITGALVVLFNEADRAVDEVHVVGQEVAPHRLHEVAERGPGHVDL